MCVWRCGCVYRTTAMSSYPIATLCGYPELAAKLMAAAHILSVVCERACLLKSVHFKTTCSQFYLPAGCTEGLISVSHSSFMLMDSRTDSNRHLIDFSHVMENVILTRTRQRYCLIIFTTLLVFCIFSVQFIYSLIAFDSLHGSGKKNLILWIHAINTQSVQRH